MKEMQTKIGGVEVLLTLDADGEGSTWCHLSIKRGGKEITGSLELANHLGGLEDDNGTVIPLASQTLDRIETWAVTNGY